VDESVQRVASILAQAEQSYGGGASKVRLPGWERFYAWRLLGWAGLAEALGRETNITELTETLERLDRLYRSEPRQEPWADFYASQILASQINS
jgi:hypothetical protein